MRWKLFLEFCLTVLAFFVIAGDVFLPQPYRGSSQQLKTNINHFLVGWFPPKAIFGLPSPRENSI